MSGFFRLHRISFQLPWLMLGLLALSSCSNSDVDLAPVKGSVKIDGEPVRGVFIIFQPTGGKPAYAMLDANGEFTLQYNVKNTGARVGLQEVFLRPPGADELGELPKGVLKPTPIPKIYRQPFETVEVKPGKNQFDFEITKDVQQASRRSTASVK